MRQKKKNVIITTPPGIYFFEYIQTVNFSFTISTFDILNFDTVDMVKKSHPVVTLLT